MSANSIILTTRGFVSQVASMETAEKIVNEMNQFFTEENRRLTVRLVSTLQSYLEVES